MGNQDRCLLIGEEGRESGLDMTEVPDDEDDDIPEMVEEVWNGRGSWYGGDVAVARSLTADGDAILTVPPTAITGTRISDGWIDVVIPLALLRWVLDGEARDRPG
jgi:hypothetical protein